MANEGLIRLWRDYAEDFTCADGTGIEVGTLLKATDPKTAIISTAQADALAGIAAREKVASDGRAYVPVYRRGIFDMVASGAVTVGSPVCSYADANYPNVVGTAVGLAAASGAAILGTAMETASDGETFLVSVNVGGAS